MRHHRNTLLAGIAALALVAGTGFASAQEPAQKEKGAQGSPPAAQPMNKAPAANNMDRRAPEQNQQRTEENSAHRAQSDHGAAPQNPKNAEEGSRGDKADKGKVGENRPAQSEQRKEGAKEGTKEGTTAKGDEKKAGKAAEEHNGAGEHNATGPDRNPRSAQDKNGNSRDGAAQRDRNSMEGLQSNASGVNVRLNDEQRTQIRTTVINAEGAPRVASVNFDIAVGTVVPRAGIRTIVVPETLVRIEPEWRGFLYFVYEDEVVIVNPRDMRIVAVLAV
jgi:Protein of unknown function (DUF1236)